MAVAVDEIREQYATPLNTTVSRNLTANEILEVASIGLVYNDIAKYCPDVVRTLGSNWLLDNSNYPHGKAGDFANSPLLYYEKNRTVAAMAPISGRLRALPHSQLPWEEHGLTIGIRRGEIQVFHARQDYEDSEKNTNDVANRHLVRLWLKSERIEWKISENLNGKKEPYESNGTEKWNFEDASL
ncbi:hypothetical protein BJ742DRAFT_885997 [Cladochytrium replicatum]|nr:hypothetical protein BJ742DRAFT_885997 [Cladochytrium replicatum]